jgi:3'5'-cyclic nucleotide phosphodiesterase
MKCEIQAMMDRERKDELPQMQVGFIDVICKPLYKVSKIIFPPCSISKKILENSGAI